MKRKLTTAALMLLAILFTACERDHLYYAATNTATVRLDVDWSKTGLKPNGLTVYAFKDDGSLYKRFDPISTPEEGYINLPTGRYTLVLMNDTPEEFDGNIDFIGQERQDSFIAQGVKDETRTQKLITQLSGKQNTAFKAGAYDDMYCIVEPDSLAVAMVQNVEVTSDMLDFFYDKPSGNINEKTTVTVEAQPQNVIYTVNVKAHVKGLTYAKGTTLSFFRGAAAGYYMGRDINSSNEVSHAFILNNRTFDEGSTTDGTISASFRTFGLPSKRSGEGVANPKEYLDINFVLINGQSYPLTFDVTDDIDVDISLDLQLKLTLNLELEIELPEPVGGGGNGGSGGEGEDNGGFATDVIDWVDQTVSIPI